jgi:hypothetical protein
VKETIRTRLDRLEDKFHSDLPVFLVTFEDGSTRTMKFLDLYFYGLSREAGITDHDGGVLEAAPLAYTKYELIRGDTARYITEFVREGIENATGK